MYLRDILYPTIYKTMLCTYVLYKLITIYSIDNITAIACS